MSNIVDLPVITTLPVPPEKVLRAASEAGMQQVFIVGYDADGVEYFAASHPNGADNLWLIERAKKALLEMGDET